MSTTTRNQNRRLLLSPTVLTAQAAKTITSLTRSTTTATATITSHGYSVNDWILIAGSDQTAYNGLFQVASVVDANNITYTMEADPGTTSGGNPTAQKGVASSIWGDGTIGVGALPTSLGGEVIGRVTNPGSAPTTPADMAVFTSDTGAAGSWRLLRTGVASSVSSDQASLRVFVARGKYAIAFFYGNVGSGVVVAAQGDEDTSLTTA